MNYFKFFGCFLRLYIVPIPNLVGSGYRYYVLHEIAEEKVQRIIEDQCEYNMDSVDYEKAVRKAYAENSMADFPSIEKAATHCELLEWKAQNELDFRIKMERLRI